jgi:DNA repair exonuclease SbcCD ATPase subunit/DNA repair exonuclease SbcCD nuclease subunit
MRAPIILQFGDLHLDASTRENVEHAMAQILALARKEHPDLIVNTGDLAMRRGSLPPWVSVALREWHCELAEVAPVLVVAGNHDLSYAEKVGTVGGALDFSAASDRVLAVERPTVAFLGGVKLAALPYPSRYLLQAQEPGLSPQEVNARAGELTERILRGLAAEAGPGAILILHGSISGARTSSEIEMTTDMDVVIPETSIPDTFAAVLAGHIHRHQQIGRVVYAGSPCPLNFGEDHPHGVVLWESGMPRFIELEPLHRMVTLDLRSHVFDIATTIDERLGEIEGARVRVLVRIARGAESAAFCESLRAQLSAGRPADVRFEIEHEQDDRSTEIEGVRRDLGHAELLALYARRAPDAEPLLPDLTRVFAEVDGALSPEEKALERYADYRLHRVALSGWKSFADGPYALDLDHLGRLVVIEGENATGKSNLAEVESFALWGKLPRGKQALSDLVRNGAREAWVEAEFEAAGSRWKVRRTVRLNAKGVGVGDLILQRQEGGIDYRTDGNGSMLGVESASVSWTPANAGTATETQKLIEQMVGPHELYLSTRFASQGDIDRLLEMTPAELKDALQSALGTKTFEARERIAKKLGAEAQAVLDKLTARITPLEEQVKQAEALAGDLALAKFAATEAEAVRYAAEVDLKQATERLDQAKVAAAEAEQARRQQADLEARAKALRERIDALERSRTECEALIAGAAAGREQLARLEELRERLPGLEAGEASHRTLTDAHAKTRSALDLALREQESATREAEQLAARIKAEREAEASHHAAQLWIDEERLERARRGAELVAKTPFGEKCVEAGCELLRSAVEDRARIPGLEAAIEARKNEHRIAVSNADMERGERTTAALARRDSATAAALSARNSHTEALAALGRSGFDSAALAGLRREIAAIPERELRGATAKAQEAEGRLSGLRGEILGLERDREAVLDQCVPFPAPVSIDSELAAVASITAEVEAARKDESKARASVSGLEGKLELLAGASDRLAALGQERDAAAHGAQVFSVFARAMSRDGLPYLILERAIPALEQGANHFLGTGDLALEIEPMRDLRSGEQKSEVNVRYRDRFGLHPLTAASGYQRVALGYALRASLALVQAETHGLKVSHWIADEGWGAFDESRVLDGQQMLIRLAERFDRVVFISHVGPIREVADTRVLVSANGSSGATMEVLQ